MLNRILIIGFFPVINGTSSFVMGVYRNLDRSCFQYDFLISEKYKDYHQYLNEIEQLGGRIFYFDYNKENFYGERIGKLKEFLLAHPEIKGIHIHDTRWQSDPLVLADELNLPVKVIQCHAAYGRSETYNHPVNSAVQQRIRSIAGPQYDRFACSDLAGIYGYQGLPYEIMPNAIDTKKYVYNHLYRTLIRDKLGISENSYVIGIVANDSVLKNSTKALKVFQEFHRIEPDSHLLIIGSQYNNKSFMNTFKSLDCTDYIHMLNSVNMVEMLYSAMDLALCTSISEGLPFAMVEAQATGLPCLISDEVSSMVCITDLAQQFSLQKKDVEWAEKILQMLKNQHERKSQIEAIKAAGYDIEDVVKKIMALYSRRIQSQ